MRSHVVASCFVLAVAVAGCARSAPPPEPPKGVTSLQTVPASLDDRARVALIDAQRQQVRLEGLHDASDDDVLRGALKWQIDTLEARIDTLLDDMSLSPTVTRGSLMRSDMVAVQREANHARNTAAWAQQEVEPPRKGNAERMHPDVGP